MGVMSRCSRMRRRKTPRLSRHACARYFRASRGAPKKMRQARSAQALRRKTVDRHKDLGMGIFTRGERAHPGFFWLGALAVTIGVGLHLPMYIKAAAMNFHVAGMPVDATMLIGMAFIAGGTAAAWHGLLPGALRPES